MLSCEQDRPERPEVWDPPPKGPPGVAPVPDEGCPDTGTSLEPEPPPPEVPEGPETPEVPDPPPKGPTG